MLSFVFWSSLGLILFHHLGYPLLLLLWARIIPRDARVPSQISCASALTITLIVPARNEARVIAAKIENICSLVYDATKLRLVLVLDGCDDETEALARETIKQSGAPFVCQFVTYKNRVGKVAVLNAQIERARSTLVALSDASAIVDISALETGAAHFEDPRVGVVCGSYRLNGSGGEAAYWRVQTELKTLEAKIAAPMGAHGAFYMFRRDLWSPLASDTINDDFVLPMSIVARGYRAIYDRSIAIGELERSGAKSTFRRRVRLGAGALQQVIRTAGLLNPSRPALALVFLSGKGLRAIMPLLILSFVSASAGLAYQGSLLHGVISIGAVVTTVLGLLAAGLSLRLPTWLTAIAFAIQAYAAAGLGMILIAIGFQARVWTMMDATASHTKLPRGARPYS